VKRELRKRVQGLRKATPLDACLERSTRIVELLSTLDVVRRAKTAALFWPIEARHEVDLRALDAALRARGVRVAYPAVVRGETEDERTGLSKSAGSASTNRRSTPSRSPRSRATFASSTS